MDTWLIVVLVLFALWVLFLEREVRRLNNDVDALCNTIIGIAHGKVRVTLDDDSTVTVQPKTEV